MSAPAVSKYVLILDFGSQYTQLIARRIRELGVYSEVKPCTIEPRAINSGQVGAIILSGGPASVSDSDAPKFNPEWLSLGIPTLGICYGLQLMAHLSGARLAQGNSREYGPSTVEVACAGKLFEGFDPKEKVAVWMSHGDHVETLPPGFELLASSKGAPVAGIAHQEKKLYAIQFHPEVSHTPRGKEILSNFLFSIAGLTKDWSPGNFVEGWVRAIEKEVSPDGQVICGLSGGVDSTVAAVIVAKALGTRLHCIFVDNGLLRKHEVDEVRRALGKEGRLPTPTETPLFIFLSKEKAAVSS